MRDFSRSVLLLGCLIVLLFSYRTSCEPPLDTVEAVAASPSAIALEGTEPAISLTDVLTIAEATANRHVWTATAIVSAVGLFSSALLIVIGLATFRARRDYQQIAEIAYESMTAHFEAKKHHAQIASYRTAMSEAEQRIQEDVERCKGLVESAHRHAGNAREALDSAVSKAKTCIDKQVERISHTAVEQYLSCALSDLSSKGEGVVERDRRYTAIGIIEQYGVLRHIEYLEAARAKSYESARNRKEIDEAIETIRMRFTERNSNE